MALRRLFLIHALITFMAGVVLIAAPEKIPETVNIHIAPPAYLICYFLGAAELALAFLSYGGSKLTDAKSLRLMSITFIVFHAATAAVEVYAFTKGTSAKIWGNVVLRIVITILFWYYGVRKKITD